MHRGQLLAQRSRIAWAEHVGHRRQHKQIGIVQPYFAWPERRSGVMRAPQARRHGVVAGVALVQRNIREYAGLGKVLALDELQVLAGCDGHAHRPITEAVRLGLALDVVVVQIVVVGLLDLEFLHVEPQPRMPRTHDAVRGELVLGAQMT